MYYSVLFESLSHFEEDYAYEEIQFSFLGRKKLRNSIKTKISTLPRRGNYTLCDINGSENEKQSISAKINVKS